MPIRTLFAVSVVGLMVSLATAGTTPAGAAQPSAACDLAIPATCLSPGGRPTTCDPARRTVTMIDRGNRFRLRRLKTYVENKRAWVARVLYGHRSGPPEFGGSFFVCWKPTRRAHFLGARSSCGGAEVTCWKLLGFSLAGHYVAFFAQAIGEKNYDLFRSVDARSGKVLRDSGRAERHVKAEPCTDVPCDPYPQVGDPQQSALVVTYTGAIAWLQQSVLRATDASGTRTLGTADGGPISGLRVSGATVYWTQGSAPHSAVLN